nr:glyoxysomal fatty acid beta-oxidation multifunctional protein MFP-A [Ipomoea batatas]
MYLSKIADGFILENTSSSIGCSFDYFSRPDVLVQVQVQICFSLVNTIFLTKIRLLFSAVKGRPSKAIVDALALFGVQIYVVDRVTFQVFTHLGAKGKFSGGFDITAFGGLTRGKVAAPKPSFVSVEILTDIVEASRKPPVAAIDGLALGGGLEIAMGVIVLKRSIFSVSAIPSLRA